MINSDWWMVVNTELPVMDRLYIYGVLELDNNRAHKLSANIIVIGGLNGMLLVGWPDKPMPNNVIISLRGNHASEDLPMPNGPNLGSKALGVFGRLQLIGKKHDVHWTTLSETMDIGTSILKLTDAVDWSAGDEIVITTTSFEPRHAEKFFIKSLTDGNKTLEINTTAQLAHTVHTETVNGVGIRMAAKVGLLTRNIVIEGADDPAGSLNDQSFGCRVLVGKYGAKGLTYSGKAYISEVQFKSCGQNGWNEKYDPRFASIFRFCFYLLISSVNL